MSTVEKGTGAPKERWPEPPKRSRPSALEKIEQAFERKANEWPAGESRESAMGSSNGTECCSRSQASGGRLKGRDGVVF